MDTVLYFQSKSKTSAPEKLAGVREIMDKRRIHVQVIEELPTRNLLAELVSFWHPMGAIVDCGGEYNELDAAIFASVRTVFFGHNPGTLPRTCLQVIHDQAATARLAARELLETGFSTFAFVHCQERRAWSEARGNAFCDALALNGKECRVFDVSDTDVTGTRHINALVRFLRALPKPCAVFAANDKTGEQVLSSAQMAGLDVPNDIAVIGVDNFEPICEHATPPLSSVEPDFRRGGEIAALMLLAAAMAKDKWHGSRVQTFGPLRIVRRASSRILRRNDQHVADAIDLIRREACCGLRSSRVAALFPCSRRMADIRFAKATGHSILAEIHAVQLDRAKELLKNGNMPLKAISDFCGFTNPNSLRKFFRKTEGMTMTAWRSSSTRTETSRP